MEYDDDTSSNPRSSLHLPASGEFDANNIPNASVLDTDEDV